MHEEHLAFPEDSAGRLMQRDFVAVPTFWTVGQTIDFMRETENLPDEFYDIFVVDPRHRPVGIVPLSRVLRTQRPVLMSAIMEDEPDHRARDDGPGRGGLHLPPAGLGLRAGGRRLRPADRRRSPSTTWWT